MTSNATFVMTHFLKLYFNVFILENKIDALMFNEICVKMCYITLEICVSLCEHGEGFLLVRHTVCQPSA
jgi:hypothetical protein